MKDTYMLIEDKSGDGPPWGVVRLVQIAGKRMLEVVGWYYTEDEARIVHSRMMFP